AMRRLNPGTSTVFWAPLGPLPAAAPARAPARLRLTARLPAAPIRLWTPPGGNSKALGFRLDAGETTGRGLERCLRTRSCALVCRPGLPGEPLQREQSLLLVPVGQASSGEPIAGVLGIVMWVPAMLSGADSPAAGSQLHFLLMEAGGDLPRDVVWSGQPSLGDAGEGDGHASTAGLNEWRWRNFLAVGGQLLELQCWAGAGGLDPEREMQLWVDSLWCLALTAVLGAVLLVSTGRRAAAAVARSA
ncbi:MAG: hypothetical protein HY303_19200, partial [Candidatus Wallbacteria bacterium]|nr:hypothetical protein [Candidatus Wallbacteria bacterium]